MIPPRRLTGREAMAWSKSSAFRHVVRGQLVCQALDSDEDEPVIAIYVLGVLAYGGPVTDDDEEEFFDADVNTLGAEEREILAAL